MVNELSEARDELQEAYEEVLGGRPVFVLIDGHKYPARYEDVTSDEVVMAGGIGETGGFRCFVPVDKFAEQPEQGASISDLRSNRRELQILQVIQRNGIEYELTAGDLAVEDNG